jgi:hypothetical protein
MEVYVCPHCDEEREHLGEHLSHMRRWHGYAQVNMVNAVRRDRRHRCRECDEVFISKRAADRHCVRPKSVQSAAQRPASPAPGVAAAH